MSATTIKQAIANMDQTTSGLIEKTTLEPVLSDIADLTAELGDAICADVTELQNLSPDDAKKAIVVGVGLFVYQSPAPGSIPSGSYAANDGVGYWMKQTFQQLSTLSDIALTNPADTQVLAYNTATGKWENKNITISALAWASLTGIPSQLSSIGSADQVLKVTSSGGAARNIGTVGLGDDSVLLSPNGTALTTIVRSLVIAAQLQQHMTSVTDSVIITNQASLRGGSASFSVVNCIIVGDVGDLSSFFVSDTLTGVIAIGFGGTPIILQNNIGMFLTPGGQGLSANVAGFQTLTVGTAADLQGTVKAENLPVFANNTAASALPLGSFYRTSTGVLMVKY